VRAAAFALRNLARSRRASFALYAVWAAACTLASSVAFYRAMLEQTGGEWSAPLDDVFIHFDYAREAARGHPFQWSAGNGYSSGNTSILYPFVLAAGYLVGFTGERLMVWAAIVAAVSVFGTALAARRLLVRFEPAPLYPSLTSLLIPPALVSIGALAWSLWSGMEVAWYLATWSLGLLATMYLERAPRERLRAGTMWLAASGVVIVLTRPEGASTLLAFGLLAAWSVRERFGIKPAVMVLVGAGLPSVVALVAQSVANLHYTGELSANGAIVKLAANHPYLTQGEKIADYFFNLRYSIFRNLDYHFADRPAFGFIVPTLAALGLAFRSTRRYSLLLWAQIAGWLLLTAFNGQVRWQNERYTMPAVAWLLLAAVLGVHGLVRGRSRPSVLVVTILGAVAVQIVGVATRPPNTAAELRFGWDLPLIVGFSAALLLRWQPLRLATAAAALFFFYTHQASKIRDQKWFFARASRNIRDQHIVAGRWLAELKPRRVLVGDAGALIYASGARGLDIIGLGGFHDLPFARAGVHGLAASIELIERMPPSERPDVMAIYPSWWGILPTWFSRGVLARFPVEGNVICGGYEDVIYRADWSVLGTGEQPRTIPRGESVRDTVDVADLVSERAHGYRFPQPAGGFTDMKVLADPANPAHDLFDGGRRISPGRAESFSLRGLRSDKDAHLVIRSAPEQPTTVRVLASGAPVGSFSLAASGAWVEIIHTLPAASLRDPVTIELRNDGPNDFIDHHVWVTQ
jgi:hypothetical protein